MPTTWGGGQDLMGNESSATDWDKSLADLDLPDRLVAKAIMSGADAASCSVLERGGEFGYILCEQDEAHATVKFRLSGDTEARVKTLPLTWVLLVAAQSATIEEISAPDLESWTWTAAATVIAERTLPAGLILPEPLRRRKLWLLAARDDRGMSAAPLSENRSLSSRGRLGDVIAKQVARTKVEGATGRLARARRQLNDESFNAVVAEAVWEYFATPAALAGSDGGQALLEYEITTFDPLIRSWQTVVSFPPERVGQTRRKRRGAISDRALRALEVEVFGAGFDSSRSKNKVISLDEPNHPDGRVDSPPTLGDTVTGTHDLRAVEQRLELGELVARSGLSPREREVLHLWVEGRVEEEIAGLLGITRGAVHSHLWRSREKAAKAAEKV